MSVELELPKEKTMEGASFRDLAWFIYGPPGIGKTTFFANVPDTWFMHTDPGLRFVTAYKTPIVLWRQFTGLVDRLVKEPRQPYGIIVIDTVDLLYTACVAHVCGARNIEHLSDESYGKGYEMVRGEFGTYISRLMNLDYGVAFISHSKEVEIRGRTIKTSKIVPTLPRQAREVVMPMVDIIGYAGYEEGAADTEEAERFMFFRPSETLEAKDRTGMLPDKCRLEYGEVKGLLAAGGIRDDDKAPEKPATQLRKKKRAIA